MTRTHSLQNKIWNLSYRSTILPKFTYDKEGKLGGLIQILPVRVRGLALTLKAGPIYLAKSILWLLMTGVRSQAISSFSIDLIITEYSGFSTWRVESYTQVTVARLSMCFCIIFYTASGKNVAWLYMYWKKAFWNSLCNYEYPIYCCSEYHSPLMFYVAWQLTII